MNHFFFKGKGGNVITIVIENTHFSIYKNTGCNRRKGPDFGRVFLMLNYSENPPKHVYPKLNVFADNDQ